MSNHYQKTKSGQGLSCPHCGSPIFAAPSVENPFPNHPVKARIYALILAKPGYYGSKTLERDVFSSEYLNDVYNARHKYRKTRDSSIITAHITQMKRLLKPLGIAIHSRRGWQGAQYRLVQL